MFNGNPDVLVTTTHKCPSAPPPDSDERLQVLLQVQDGVQGGRPPLVPQHQEKVGVRGEGISRAIVFCDGVD